MTISDRATDILKRMADNNLILSEAGRDLLGTWISDHIQEAVREAVADTLAVHGSGGQGPREMPSNGAARGQTSMEVGVFEGDKVAIVFSQSVPQVNMEPKQALQIAELLRKTAHKIRKGD